MSALEIYAGLVARAQPYVCGRLVLSQREDAHLSAFGPGEEGEYGDFVVFCGGGYANVRFSEVYLGEQLRFSGEVFGDLRPRFDVEEDELFWLPRLVAGELKVITYKLQVAGYKDIVLRAGVELMALAEWQGKASFGLRCERLAEKVRGFKRAGVRDEALEVFRRGLLYYSEKLKVKN